ncbi:nucleotidyltransferase family protein [bacterium]|nr:hypothetical protein [bacterium]MBU3955145.1 nucleotidyltransferase family protein [bacterium]
MNLSDIDVLILAGGKGKRLRSVVKNKPKPMAEIGGRPFLDFLILHLKKKGFTRVIICTGYMADKIHKYYQRKNMGIDIKFSGEEKPLGTGGAIKNAFKYIKSDPFVVINGDSFCGIDYTKFLRFHLKNKALATIALVKVKNDKKDFGSIEKDMSGRITNFREKIVSKSAWINAGGYLFSKKILELIPKDKQFSLEYQLFPNLHNCFGFAGNHVFVDIGTPEGLKKAGEIL